MPTREQIEHGAAHYDVEEAKALYAARDLEKLGLSAAEEWKAKAAEYERIARELRRMASG